MKENFKKILGGVLGVVVIFIIWFPKDKLLGPDWMRSYSFILLLMVVFAMFVWWLLSGHEDGK